MVLLVLSLATNTGHAEQCSSTFGGATFTAEQAESRAQQLEERLHSNQRHIRYWTITWLSIYSGFAATQAGIAVASDSRDNRAVFGVGAARSAIAAAAVPILGIRSQRLQLTGSPCADLIAAENALRENVRLHRKGRGWLKHAGVVGLNLAAFLALGFGYDSWQRGAIGGVIGIAVGETQIYTQPMGSRDILYDYESSMSSANTDGPPRALLAPYTSDDGIGLALHGWFH